MNRAIYLLVLPFALSACPKQGELTAAEAQESVQQASASTQAENLASVSVDISTNFTIGGAVQNAATELKSFLDKYPDSLYAWSNLGVVRFQQGKLPEAKQSAEKLQRLDPFDPGIQIEVRQVSAETGAQVLRSLEDGKRAYVANSGSANVSIIDLEKRMVIGNVRVGSAPGLARVSPDGSTVVVSNRGDNTVSMIDAKTLRVRTTLPICQS